MKKILCGLAFIGLAACGKPEVMPPAPVTITKTETRTVLPSPPPLPTKTTQCIHNELPAEWPVEQAMANWNKNGKNLLSTYTPGMLLCTNHVLTQLVQNLGDSYGTTSYYMSSATVVLIDATTPPGLRLSVVCHELGHVLGLPHSQEADSCMRADARYPAQPSSNDLQTVGKTIWEWSSASKNSALH